MGSENGKIDAVDLALGSDSGQLVNGPPPPQPTSRITRSADALVKAPIVPGMEVLARSVHRREAGDQLGLVDTTGASDRCRPVRRANSESRQTPEIGAPAVDGVFFIADWRSSAAERHRAPELLRGRGYRICAGVGTTPSCCIRPSMSI